MNKNIVERKEKINMRTADEMLDLVDKEKYCSGILDKNKGVGKTVYKGFSCIAENLDNDEEVLLPFVAQGFLEGEVNIIGGYCAGAFTSKKRLLMSHVGVVMGSDIKIVLLKSTNDITKKNALATTRITIDTIRDKVGIQISKWAGDKFHKDVMELFRQYKWNEDNNTNAPTTNISFADELKKFKELLDMGVITQEEFDAKKKQLLGL